MPHLRPLQRLSESVMNRVMGSLILLGGLAAVPPAAAQDLGMRIRALVMKHADPASMGYIAHGEGETAWTCSSTNNQLTCEFTSGPKTWECDPPAADGSVICREINSP